MSLLVFYVKSRFSPHLYFVVECDVDKGGSCDARPHGVQTSREGGDTLLKLEPDVYRAYGLYGYVCLCLCIM